MSWFEDFNYSITHDKTENIDMLDCKEVYFDTSEVNGTA